MKKIRHIWDSLSNIGVKPSMEMSLQDRIKLSNRLGLANMMVGFVLILAFSGVSTTNKQGMFLGLVIFPLIFPLLNYLGLHIITRILLSLLPPFIVFAYDVSAKMSLPSEPLSYVSPHFVVAASVCLPMALFRWVEWWALWGCVCVILAGALGFDAIYEALGAHFYQHNFEPGRYRFVIINVVVVLAIIMSSFVFLLYTTYKSETTSRKLLAESEARNADLAHSQAQLQNTLAAVEQIRLEEEKRAWLNNALAEFAKLLRRHDDSVKFYQKIISQLCQNIAAQRGLFYIVRRDEQGTEANDGESVVLVAAYACDIAHIQQSRLFVGEGLVGQTIARRRPIILSDIPPEYARIQTGMHQIIPKQIAIYPLVLQGDIYGAIELAMIEPITEIQKEFLDQIVEGIARVLMVLAQLRENARLHEEIEHYKNLAEGAERNAQTSSL